MNIQDWLPLVWFLLVWSPCSKGLSRVFSSPTVQRHQFFTSGGQSIGASASALVLPMNIQNWSILGLTGLISLQHKKLWRVLRHQNLKASILWRSAFLMVQFSYPYMTNEKIIPLTIWTFVNKMMPLLFNMLSRFVIAYLPRSKHLFISWVQWPSSVILKPKKIKSLTVSTFPHLFGMKWWDQMPWS